MRFDHFGLVAPFYERVIPTPDLSRLRSVANLRANDRLLDVGGGTGRISAHLTAAVASVSVIDLSHGMLRQASGKGLMTCQGSAEALPFSNAVFDRVVAVDSFHHFLDHQLAARELLRVLAPGGRLTIEEPDIRRPLVKLIALGEKVALMRSHFRAPDDLARLFESSVTSTEVHLADHAFWLVVEKADLHQT